LQSGFFFGSLGLQSSSPQAPPCIMPALRARLRQKSSAKRAKWPKKIRGFASLST